MGAIAELLLILAVLGLPVVALAILLARPIFLKRKRTISARASNHVRGTPQVVYNKRLSEAERARLARESPVLAIHAKRNASALAGAMLFYGVARVIGLELGIVGSALLFGLGAGFGSIVCSAAVYSAAKRGQEEKRTTQ